MKKETSIKLKVEKNTFLITIKANNSNCFNVALEVLVKRHKQRLGQLINRELHRADVVLGTLVNCNDSKLSHLP